MDLIPEVEVAVKVEDEVVVKTEDEAALNVEEAIDPTVANGPVNILLPVEPVMQRYLERMRNMEDYVLPIYLYHMPNETYQFRRLSDFTAHFAQHAFLRPPGPPQVWYGLPIESYPTSE